MTSEPRPAVVPAAEVNLIEPAHLNDIFVTDIGPIQSLGSCARFILVAENPVCYSEHPEQIAVSRLVIPIECLPRMIMKAFRFTCQEIGKRWTGTFRSHATRH
jgi:hypothetical protein